MARISDFRRSFAPEDGASVSRFRIVALMAGGFAVLSFAIHALIAHMFDSAGLFVVNDILFNADLSEGLDAIANGRRSVRTIHPDLLNSIHPYLWLYFGPVIRVLGKAATVFGWTDMGEAQWRAAAGLFAIPFAAAVQSALFTVLLSVLECPLSWIALISALDLAVFGNLMFGSLPEHFALTNLAITLLLLGAVMVARHPRLDRLRLWIPLGLFAAGITITNTAFFAIAHVFTRLFVAGRGMWRIAARTLVLSLALFLFVIATAHVATLLMDGRPDPAVARHSLLMRFIRDPSDLPQAPERFIAALGNAVAPGLPYFGTRAASADRNPQHPDGPGHPAFSFEPMRGEALGPTLLGGMAIAGVLLGSVVALIRGGLWRLVGAICTSVILFNFALHAVWGDEYFLYAEHWLAASLLLIAGLLAGATRWRGGAGCAMALYIVAVAWNNAAVLQRMISVWQ